MLLPATDAEFLVRRDFDHEVVSDGTMTCVIVKRWSLPNGLSQTHADLLMRLQPGYPDLPPDMWWFDPSLTLADGTIIQATEVIENHLGRSWQRWSRHFTQGQWRSGVDGLESFVALIEREVSRCSTSAG